MTDSEDLSNTPEKLGEIPIRPSARVPAEKTPSGRKRSAAFASKSLSLGVNYIPPETIRTPENVPSQAETNHTTAGHGLTQDAPKDMPPAPFEPRYGTTANEAAPERHSSNTRFWVFAALGAVLLVAALIYLLSRPHSTTQGSTAATGGGEGVGSGASSAPLGVTDTEVRFGMVGPFTGPSKELGREMAIGLKTAFNEASQSGGVAGRQIELVTADDGYDPNKTASAVASLREHNGILGYVGNVGTPTAAVSLPYALRNHMLFFGGFTGAELLRKTPPDRYVFNYRPSYSEETGAAVRYLVRVRGIHPQEIAVFAQHDAFGDSGYEGVLKTLRTLGNYKSNAVLRMSYERNTLELTGAINQLNRHKQIKAVVMVATYRAAAKFIELTHNSNPGLIYTNVSFAGGTELADELKLLGPSYMNGVIVTETVPDVEGTSTVALEYRENLAHSFPGERPDNVSFEGFLAGRLLVESLRRTGRDLNVESLVKTLEGMHNVELNLGSPVSYSSSEHQASHKVWGMQLTSGGTYNALDLE